MSEVESKDFKTEPATRDTRCRYCWARIERGDVAAKPPAETRGGIVAEVYNIYFHVECPKHVQPFPVIGQIDDKGEYIGPEIPDHPYAARPRT